MSSGLEFSLFLAGSICLLLWGSYTLRSAAEEAFSSRIRAFICSASQSRGRSFLCGMMSALILQSTTATILLTTSFISTGLLSLGVAIVVILGADLGSALAARVLFLDLSLLAPAALVAGLGLHRFSRTWKKMQLGRIFIGLGLMLLAIQLIRQVVAPVAAQPVPEYVIDFFQSVPWMILLACALATWLAHSSVAVILVIASVAGSELLSPELAIAAVLGANLGAGIIPLTLVNSRNSEAYSAVVANFLLRAFMAVLIMLLSPELSGYMSYLGDDPGIRVIHTHILVNVLLALLFVPMNARIAETSRKILEAWKPEKLVPGPHTPGSSLDPEMVKKPAQAITCARREAFRLADIGMYCLVTATRSASVIFSGVGGISTALPNSIRNLCSAVRTQ